MEIKTRRDDRAPREATPASGPERSRYLRRKTSQKVRRAPWAGRVLVRALRILVRAAAVTAVVAGAVFALVNTLSSTRFSLKTVTFVGCKQADPVQLEAMIRREFPGHVLRMDLNQLRNRLEQERWIRQADVRRVLPSGLVIRIAERLPAVILELNGEFMLADSDGILLDQYDPGHGKLDVPILKGFSGNTAESYRSHHEENAARVRQGLQMLADLESGSPAFARNISEVDLSEPGNVKLLLVDDTAEVFLGDRDFLKRFRTLMSNLSQYRELRAKYQEIASIDLRFEGQIIYRPRTTQGDQVMEAAEVRQ